MTRYAVRRRSIMREIGTELKAMKLYGMASAWGKLSASGNDVGIHSSRWLIEQLLDAESARGLRSSARQGTQASHGAVVALDDGADPSLVAPQPAAATIIGVVAQPRWRRDES